MSDFEQDADGWVVADLPLALGNPPTVNSYFAVTHSPTGGNPGGHILMYDPTSLWFHFSAPAKFLGDKSSYYGGRLTYDMSVNFMPAADGQFQLESSLDLHPDPALWTPEGSPLAGSTATPLLFETTTTGELRKFFRVRSQ